MRSIGYDLDAPVGARDFPAEPLFRVRELRRDWLFLVSGLVLVAGCAVYLIFALRSAIVARSAPRRTA